jgi:hypothetical protein
MILDAAYLDCLEAVIAGDAGDITPDSGLNFFRDTFLPVFRAEDYVDTVAGVGV